MYVPYMIEKTGYLFFVNRQIYCFYAHVPIWIHGNFTVTLKIKYFIQFVYDYH